MNFITIYNIIKKNNNVYVDTIDNLNYNIFLNYIL